MTASDIPPPLPPDRAGVVAHFTAPPARATSLGAVILAMLSLEVGALLRPKLWLKLALSALALVVVTRLSVGRATPEQFERWMIGVVALKFVPLMCLTVGGGILRNPIRNFTIEYLWTRSVRKPHLVIAAWVAAVVIVTLQAFLATGVVYATCGFLGVKDLWPTLPPMLGVEFVMILAFTALSLAFGVFSGKYMVMGLFYGLVVESGVSQIPTNLNQIAVTSHANVLLDYARQSAESPGIGATVQAGASILTIAALGLAVACAVFTYKQYSIGAEKET